MAIFQAKKHLIGIVFLGRFSRAGLDPFAGRIDNPCLKASSKVATIRIQCADSKHASFYFMLRSENYKI